jgi:DNA-binding transcriptional ArsR family regulator
MTEPSLRSHDHRTKWVEDTETLKAMAHPLRLRMLGRLRLEGPATASHLGRVFGETSGSTSYHLRQLERYGFVEPAPEQPNKRERVWQACHDSTSFQLRSGDDPTAQAAVDTILQVQLEHLLDGVRRRQREGASWPPEWREVHMSSDFGIRITAQRLGELKAVIAEAVQAHETPDDPDARLVILQVHSYPHETEQP